MRDLVEFVVRSLVEDPDAVRVTELTESDGTVLRCTSPTETSDG
jgi:predicted RNA-binding protein YlqC (UPF0109 family)